MTNAEKIAKNIGSMALMMSNTFNCDSCPLRYSCVVLLEKDYSKKCYNLMKEWLMKEAEE